MAEVYTADVLVIGGGPAATWAALKAAGNGSNVILVDKGYCGTSGATAPSGTGVWAGLGDEYQEMVNENYRVKIGGFLAEQKWKDRVKEQARRNLIELGKTGFKGLLNENLELISSHLPGPDYMRHMRKLVKRAGVTIFDHAPALNLLVDDNGEVAGGQGGFLQKNDASWQIKAKAVVLATGGCAYLSNALGCNVNTGDGYLMAAETGAELSGMEFGNLFAISPVFSSVTKNAFYRYGRYYHEDGSVVKETELLSEPFTAANVFKVQTMLAKRLPHEKIYCRLELAKPHIWEKMRQLQPNFFLPFDKLGINPFVDKFEITLRAEGTVRGTSGINIVDDDCRTNVPGLYAAGDAATRELVAGAFSGGGSHSAAWAMTSGVWAGLGASEYAKTKQLSKHAYVVSSLPKKASENGRNAKELLKDLQAVVFPVERNFFKTQATIDEDLAKLNRLWEELKDRGLDKENDIVFEREVASMIATARWTFIAANERKESRGLHQRLDYPQMDEKQRHRIILKGVHEPLIRYEPVKSEVYV